MREKYKKIITMSSIVVLTCGIINNVIAIIYSFVGINEYLFYSCMGQFDRP